MKYLLLIVILFASCTPNGKEKFIEYNNTNPIFDYRVVIIDRCEYIEVANGHTYSLTHKGDCNNSIHPEHTSK